MGLALIHPNLRQPFPLPHVPFKTVSLRQVQTPTCSCWAFCCLSSCSMGVSQLLPLPSTGLVLLYSHSPTVHSRKSPPAGVRVCQRVARPLSMWEARAGRPQLHSYPCRNIAPQQPGGTKCAAVQELAALVLLVLLNHGSTCKAVVVANLVHGETVNHHALDMALRGGQSM